MKHFIHFTKANSLSANFENIYQTGLKNLISNNTEPIAKKYIRKKKEQLEATSSDEKES
jgi:hypothetical protein